MHIDESSQREVAAAAEYMYHTRLPHKRHASFMSFLSADLRLDLACRVPALPPDTCKVILQVSKRQDASTLMYCRAWLQPRLYPDVP